MFEEKLIAGHDDDDMLSYIVLQEMIFCFMFCRTFDIFFIMSCYTSTINPMEININCDLGEKSKHHSNKNYTTHLF